MKKISTKIQLVFLFLILGSSAISAQSKDSILTTVNEKVLNKDSVILKKNSVYVRTMPFATYTGAGFFQDRITQNVEFGKSVGVLDIGLAVGRTTLRPDTTHYVQARVTLDAGQISIFSNELSIGAGYIFNSTTPVLLEFSSTILAQVSENLAVGLIVGVTDVSGTYNDNSRNFYGIFLRFGLLRSENGGLILSHKTHRRLRRRR